MANPLLECFFTDDWYNDDSGELLIRDIQLTIM